MSYPEMIDIVFRNTKPLEYPRGDRLPLYVWPAMGAEMGDDRMAEEIIQKLNDRGIAFVSSWNHGQKTQSLSEGLRIGAIQTTKHGKILNQTSIKFVKFFPRGSVLGIPNSDQKTGTCCLHLQNLSSWRTCSRRSQPSKR